MEDLIEVTVKESAPDFASGQFKVVLQDNNSGRILSIWVGQFEGTAISLGIQEAWTPRPMTHDLTINIMNKLQAQVKSVVITDIRDNTFFAEIHLTAKENELIIDSRPSDAIAIAVRLKKPIFVTKKLSDKMSDEIDDIFERLQPKETIH